MKILNEVISNLETYKGVEYINREELIKSLKLAKEELNKQLILSSVSQQRELLLQAYKDGFQAATDSIIGANEMVKNKTLQ